MGEVVVEGCVGNETRHADETPAGERRQSGVDRVEVGDGIADAECVKAAQEFVAGAGKESFLQGLAPIFSSNTVSIVRDLP